MRCLLYRTDSKIARRILVAFIAACLLMLSFPLVADASTATKSNVDWNLSGGVLTISGQGEMKDYSEQNRPEWYDSREQIKAVVISEGVTSVGEMAFYNCSSLQSVAIPSSVSTIRDAAFAECEALTTVSFSEGLNYIGANAFYDCNKLNAVRLPESLVRIDYQAFYLCKSLTSIRVPANVTYMGAGIFAYCENLLQASVESRLLELPDWTFYGCSSLVNVSLPLSITDVGEYAFKGCDSLENAYHDGLESDRETVSDQIQTDLPEFSGVKEGDADSIGSSSASSSTTGNSGETINSNKEVVETENATVNVTVQTTTLSNPSASNKSEVDINIDATIENESGWQDLLDKTNQYVSYPERLENEQTTVNKIQVNVNLRGDITIPSDVLAGLAGTKVNMNITTSDGNTWSIDMEQVEASDLANAYNLNYTMTQIDSLTKEQKALVGDVMSFLVKFEENIPFKVTIKIPLGHSYAGHCATISQKPILKGWEIIQTVVIDYNGDAYFYLDSLDKSTEYMVSIDAEGVDVSNALIPETMADQYGGLTDEFGNKYVITGTKSSWGINLKQLTLIVVGIIVACVVVVSAIMMVMFKMRAQKEKIRRMVENGIPFETAKGKRTSKKPKERLKNKKK